MLDEKTIQDIKRSIERFNIDQSTGLSEEAETLEKQLNTICLRQILHEHDLKHDEGRPFGKCMQEGCPRDHKPEWPITNKHIEVGRIGLLERYKKAQQNTERFREDQAGKGKGKHVIIVIR